MSPLGKFVAELAAILVMFAVVGGLIGAFATYRSRVEDPATPSRLVTVVGVWDSDGGALCRAFPYRDLRPSLDTLLVRFDLSSDDIDGCRQALDAYDPDVGWPRKLSDDEQGYEAYYFEIEDTDPLEIKVHRATDDPAVWAETRYRVEPNGTISHLSTRTASDGQGLGPVFGAILGVVAWFFWAALRLLRLLAGRESPDEKRRSG